MQKKNVSGVFVVFLWCPVKYGNSIVFCEIILIDIKLKAL